MPFLDDIVGFINDTLKAGTLNKERLQPALFHGLASTMQRSTGGSKETGKLETLPAIIHNDGSITAITPDDKKAIQVYHKLLNKTYGYEKKSYGDGHYIKSTSDLALVVFSNSKLTGKASHVLEPIVLFGMPQKLSTEIQSGLHINSCLITPISSSMDHFQVFKSEYPNSDYFLNNQYTMFSIRYRIETTFSQACIDSCMC